MIFIYDDGIHNNAQLMTAVQNTATGIDVRYCTPNMIIAGCLANAKLLIMPGGADLYFCEKLNGVGNQRIKDFVFNGGSYLGICAGAYYACAHLDWNNGEIDGTRELAFYDGKAIGPVFEWIENKNSIYKGSLNKAVSLSADDDIFLTLYNGGGTFTEPKTDDIAILARYSDLLKSPPAIIQGQYGEGHYILSSPHIERHGDFMYQSNYELFNPSFKRDNKEFDKLQVDTDKQKHFFETTIGRLINI